MEKIIILMANTSVHCSGTINIRNKVNKLGLRNGKDKSEIVPVRVVQTYLQNQLRETPCPYDSLLKIMGNYFVQ